MSMQIETPFVPSNLILPPELRGLSVEGDVYNICERIKEISPDLSIQAFANPTYPFVVVERCADGVERVVVKVKELDARVIQHLQRLMSQPLPERIKEIEASERKLEAEEKENALDELYERLGRPMWSQLEHDGFIDTRPVSYPKKGVKPTKS